MALGALRAKDSLLGKGRSVSMLSEEAAVFPPVALFPDSVKRDQLGGPETFLHLRLCSGDQTRGLILPSGLVQSSLCVRERAPLALRVGWCEGWMGDPMTCVDPRPADLS